MQWYYLKGTERVGPVDEPAFQALVQQGGVAADTLVWNAGMKEWTAFGKLAPGTAADATAVCTICKRTVPADDVIRYENATVCAACKPTFVQQLREGTAPTADVVFAGFWLRFCAVFIDGLIIGVFNFVLNFIVMAGVVAAAAENPNAATAAMFVLYGIQFTVQALYDILMVGKYGATLGKMVFKLRVVTPGGGRVTYARATGRHFAKIVSYITLYIGFIMAGFDKEKRALHDHMCGTRVIRT
ncbi:MAG TPA: RDD family protein [Kiritimatiellia bacterium]